MTVNLAPSADTVHRLTRVASADDPADLVIRDGTLVNVYTEELLSGWGVVIADGHIAYVGPDVDTHAASARKTIDASGLFVAPGLIDAHTHLNSVWLQEFCRAHALAGVTTLVIDAGNIANNIGGAAAMRELLDEMPSSTVRPFMAIAPQRGLDPIQNQRLGRANEWATLLDHEHAIGVGEVNWRTLVAGDPWAESILASAHSKMLSTEAHTSGARAPALNSLRSFGIAGDHEATSSADVLRRARLGFHVSIRAGAEGDDFAPFASLFTGSSALDIGAFSLVTDGPSPNALLGRRLLNAVVVGATEAGLSLPRALRMATRSAAERHGLGRWIGGLAPSMLADVILFEGVRGLLDPHAVLVAGESVEVGEPRLTDTAARELSLHEFDRTLLDLDDLRSGTFRTIRIDSPLVTKEEFGPADGAHAIVAIDKQDPRHAFRGLLRGYGLRKGAVALTSGWDSQTILAVGCSAAELRRAIERTARIGGGAVVVEGDQVIAEWQAEIGGTFTRAPLATVAAETGAVDAALTSLGCPWPDPRLTLEVQTSASIPFLRICPAGYFDCKSGAIVGLHRA
jgi:adenine deaminase